MFTKRTLHSTALHCAWQTHHMQCLAEEKNFTGIDCSIFTNPKPMTLALSVLVIIEMMNALNRYS